MHSPNAEPVDDIDTPLTYSETRMYDWRDIVDAEAVIRADELLAEVHLAVAETDEAAEPGTSTRARPHVVLHHDSGRLAGASASPSVTVALAEWWEHVTDHVALGAASRGYRYVMGDEDMWGVTEYLFVHYPDVDDAFNVECLIVTIQSPAL